MVKRIKKREDKSLKKQLDKDVFKEDSEHVIFLKKKSLDASVREGCGAATMVGAGQSFIIPYALAFNATNFQIGIFSSLIGLIGPLVQLKGSRLVEFYSRKKILMFAIFLQALMWIPIILLSLIFFFGIWVSYIPFLLMLFYAIHLGFGAVAIPAWFSWMGDLVPDKLRGDYFGKRNRIVGFLTISSMLIAGFILDFFRTRGFVLIGFSIVFSIAMIARFYSVFVFKEHYEPKLELKKGYYFSLWDFTKRGFKDNFGKFILFGFLFYVAVSISSPFYAVYMINELEFSYFWFTLITVSQSFFSILFLPFWGKFSDKYGNRITIILAGVFLPIVPFLWLVSASKLYLLIIPTFVGGVFWWGCS